MKTREREHCSLNCERLMPESRLERSDADVRCDHPALWRYGYDITTHVEHCGRCHARVSADPAVKVAMVHSETFKARHV